MSLVFSRVGIGAAVGPIIGECSASTWGTKL